MPQTRLERGPMMPGMAIEIDPRSGVVRVVTGVPTPATFGGAAAVSGELQAVDEIEGEGGPA